MFFINFYSYIAAIIFFLIIISISAVSTSILIAITQVLNFKLEEKYYTTIYKVINKISLEYLLPLINYKKFLTFNNIYKRLLNYFYLYNSYILYIKNGKINNIKKKLVSIFMIVKVLKTFKSSNFILYILE